MLPHGAHRGGYAILPSCVSRHDQDQNLLTLPDQAVPMYSFRTYPWKTTDKEQIIADSQLNKLDNCRLTESFLWVAKWRRGTARADYYMLEALSFDAQLAVRK